MPSCLRTIQGIPFELIPVKTFVWVIATTYDYEKAPDRTINWELRRFI